MKVIEAVSGLAALGHRQRRGVVFTMGALHAGHAELMRACRELIGPDSLLLVTIFVNPTQFNDPRDLERYPRTPDADLAVCEAAGVDVVFMPSVEEMYPPGVDLPRPGAGALGGVLEGASRPGHFDGVAQVVHRLISVTEPDVTCFGEKDYQQLAVVRGMAAASGFDCEIVGVPTVREADGLALSSRNALLSPAARALAPKLHQSLQLVAAELRGGASVEAAVAAGRLVIESEPAFELDYLVVTDSQLNTPPVLNAGHDWQGRVLVAARLDGVRLIDNLPVEVLR